MYFARPDSIIDNISVYRARMRMGDKLAEKIQRERPDHDIDVVIPIPDTSRTSALQLAQRLGLKYREGFIKNRYIGRTFIMPGQEQREKSVRRKLNAIDLEFRGKNVLLVDDSIVRGTTSAQIIELAREAGAAQGVLRLRRAAGALPERVWHRHAGGQRARRCWPHGRRGGAAHRRRLAHLPGSATTSWRPAGTTMRASKEFDTSCFSGEYVTGDVTPEYLARLQHERSDEAKSLRRDGRSPLKVVRRT